MMTIAKSLRPDPPPVPLTREQKLASVVHANQSGRDKPHLVDAMTNREAFLAKELRKVQDPYRRAQFQRRLRVVSEGREAEQSVQDARNARQAFIESAEYQLALSDSAAFAETLALRSDPDLPESLVTQAAELRNFIRDNATPEALASYKEQESQLLDAFTEARRKSIEASKQRIKDAQAYHKQLKQQWAEQPELPSASMEQENNEPQSVENEADGQEQPQPSE